MTAEDILKILLEEARPDGAQALIEASVHLGTRSRKFVASFRDEFGNQVWRSTGLTDRDAALALARKWEEAARRKRAAQSAPSKKLTIRVKPGSPEHLAGMLSQAEVAAYLRISTRAVREIEKRAIAKLRRHPALRQLWQEWTGEVDEATQAPGGRLALSQAEIEAFYGLAETSEERRVLEKLISLTQR
jgi:hypothetical protein